MKSRHDERNRGASLHFVSIIATISMVLLAAAYNESGARPRSRKSIATRTLDYHRPGIAIEVVEVQVVLKSVRHRREVNRRLARLAREMYDEYLDWYTSYWDQLGGYSRNETPLYAISYVDTWYIDSNLVSLRFSIDVYSGGAHPNGTFESLTLELSGDTVRELNYRDLFSGGKRVDTVIADEAVSQVLHEQKGLNPEENLLWSHDDLRQSLIDYGFESFVIDTAGINLATWPGPHVMGPIHVTIPYEALDPIIPAGGVLDMFLTRRKSQVSK